MVFQRRRPHLLVRRMMVSQETQTDLSGEVSQVSKKSQNKMKGDALSEGDAAVKSVSPDDGIPNGR